MSWYVVGPVMKRNYGSANAKLVMAMLADCAAHDGGSIWPSVATIAEESNLSERTVQNVIADLIQMGVLVLEVAGGGRNKPSRYRIDMAVVEALPKVGRFKDETVQDLHPSKETPQTATETPQTTTLNPAGFAPDPINNPIKEPITLDALFEEFWKAYPKRLGSNPKTPAKASYLRARKTTSHEQIMAGAKAYAASRAGDDPKYTAQAVTWLNQRRWEDDVRAATPANPVEPWRFRIEDEPRKPNGKPLPFEPFQIGGDVPRYAPPDRKAEKGEMPFKIFDYILIAKLTALGVFDDYRMCWREPVRPDQKRLFGKWVNPA